MRLVAVGAGLHANAAVTLLAKATLSTTSAGYYTDLSGLNYNLENRAAAALLGGLGSGIAYAGGTKFLALPDRGPNAVSYDSAIDDTASYVLRFHTIQPWTASRQPRRRLVRRCSSISWRR